MDRIAVRGIRANGRHGANPGERDAEQPFELDLVFDVDLRAPGTSDALDDTVDYARIYATVCDEVRNASYALLEKLAERILARIFDDVRIARAELSIAKPNLLDGATPSVTLVRDNPRYRAAVR